MRHFLHNSFVLTALICALLFSVSTAASAKRNGNGKPVQQTPEDVNPIAMQLDRAAPANFDADTTIEIQVTISASTVEGVTAIGLRETPPEGWLYGEIRAISNELPVIAKQDEGSGIIEFAWITPPIMPVTFAYTLQVPPPGPTSSGNQSISGQVEYRTDSGKLVSPPVLTFLQGKDVVPPEIFLQGPNPYEMVQGESYQEPGYTATDDVDGDVTGKVKVSGNVDSGTPGTYQKTYTVSDKAGNETIKTRVVRVKKKPEEKPPNNTPEKPNKPIRRNTGGAVGTAFDDFGDEPAVNNDGTGRTNVPQDMSEKEDYAKNPDEAGQARNPDSMRPQANLKVFDQGMQSSPDEYNDKGGKINEDAAKLAELAKGGDISGKPATPAADMKTDDAKADTASGTVAAKKVEPETKLAKAADASPAVSPEATAAPLINSTPAIAVPAAVTAPQPTIAERVKDNLGKMTRREVTALAGLGLAFLTLGIVSFMFWRGAYRPTARR